MRAPGVLMMFCFLTWVPATQVCLVYEKSSLYTFLDMVLFNKRLKNDLLEFKNLVILNLFRKN